MKKKIIISLLIAVSALGVIFNQRLEEMIVPEKPVNKDIAFTIYKGANYTAPVYDQALASVCITVEKVRGNKRTKVWAKTINALQINQYPDNRNALSQQITIPNIFDRKEHLEITYILTYDSKGNELQIQNGETISKGSKTGVVKIPV